MTVRPLVKYPDPRLRAAAAAVAAFDDALRTLAADLLETLHAAAGIGITAPHIGIAQRVVVLALTPAEGAKTYINPAIVWASPERIRGPEGSVAMPGVADEIERAARVRVRYQDLSGAPSRSRKPRPCARCAISTRSTSSTASSGCRNSRR